MKIMYVIGLCGIMSYCGGALGAVSGFPNNALCDKCVGFVSCVSQKLAAAWADYDCDALQNINKTEAELIKNVSTECMQNYSMSDIAAEYFDDYGISFVWNHLYQERCYGESYFDMRDYLIGNIGLLMSACAAEGYCACRKGSYIQPRGVEYGKLGINSACLQCPDGGTSDDEYVVGLNYCYIPAGTFSDGTGTGEMREPCYTGYASAEEQWEAMQ